MKKERGESYLDMPLYIKFYDNDLKKGKNNHKVARVLFAPNQLNEPIYEDITELLQHCTNVRLHSSNSKGAAQPSLCFEKSWSITLKTINLVP